jgi:DNA-binding transcriptional regulator YiaG
MQALLAKEFLILESACPILSLWACTANHRINRNERACQEEKEMCMYEESGPGVVPQKTTKDAMRELRERLGMTQQRFAHEMDMAIRTVAHYESDRTPKPSQLARFAHLAEEKGWHDIATIFNNALISTLGLSARNSVIAMGRLETAIGDISSLLIKHPELAAELSVIHLNVHFAWARLREINPFKESAE